MNGLGGDRGSRMKLRRREFLIENLDWCRKNFKKMGVGVDELWESAQVETDPEIKKEVIEIISQPRGPKRSHFPNKRLMIGKRVYPNLE